MNAPLETSLPRIVPIGSIRTPFRDKSATPRQPRADKAAVEGLITLNAGHNFEQALEDLAGFELIWIISWFHQNNNWKPKVLPPRGTKIKRGVFATRSPHRPNPIGLSLARLIEVKGRTVRVAEIDLLDGTPILDLKPYLPETEAFPGAKAGWLDKGARETGIPRSVEWSAFAAEQHEWLLRNHGIDLETAVERVLAADVTPHPYRRISVLGNGLLRLAVKSWRVEFMTIETTARVVRIVSGYSAGALTAKQHGTLHDELAHLEFHARFPGASVS